MGHFAAAIQLDATRICTPTSMATVLKNNSSPHRDPIKYLFANTLFSLWMNKIHYLDPWDSVSFSYLAPRCVELL